MMWSYWRDKLGEVEALRTHYASCLESDEVLRLCVAQIEAAKLAIDARMNEKYADDLDTD